MRKIISFIICLCVTLSCFSLAGCANQTRNKNSNLVLRICNCEDYISENEETGETLYEEFERVYEQIHDVDITIEYTTYGTNEILYNNLKINPGSYDLVCPSDYMIQKMIDEDMLDKFNDVENDVPNYASYGSPFVKQLFDENGWTDYSIPYMWGTMGFIYNTQFVTKEEAETWECAINPKFSQLTTIKDSVRDTYFLGVALAKIDELKQEHEKYLNNPDGYREEYHEYLEKAFNDTSKKTVSEVEEMLTIAKENAFTVEVDSGKGDMITGKIWLNFAWSGDAVYALDEAEADGVELCYAVPKEGSNIWFDGWVMPKGANKKLASAFLNYISSPEKAIENMDYIGYTSAIAGSEVLARAFDYYGCEIEEAVEVVDLSYFFANVDGITDEDCLIPTAVMGRQFETQYPTRETVDSCAIMKPFGEDDEAINAMWNRVKAGGMGTYFVIIIISVSVLAILTLAYIAYIKGWFVTHGKKGFKVVSKCNHVYKK